MGNGLEEEERLVGVVTDDEEENDDNDYCWVTTGKAGRADRLTETYKNSSQAIERNRKVSTGKLKCKEKSFWKDLSISTKRK